MSDVRSLEEVIAATLLEKVKPRLPDFALVIDAEQPLIDAIAAAVREWCLAPQQIERATTSLLASVNVAEPADINAWTKLARAALLAVIGDTPVRESNGT